MKTSIILLLVALVGVFAQSATNDQPDAFGQVRSWAGDTSRTSTQFAPPNNALSCLPRPSSSYNYTAFTTSFTTAGVRQIGVMAANAFRPFIQVYAYTAFNPLASCGGLVRLLANGNQASSAGVLIVNDPFYFAANTNYTFVVTSSSVSGTVAGDTGSFVLSIFASIAAGATTSSSPLWTPSSAVASGCVTFNNPPLGQQNLATFTWSQPASANANFDVLVMFENANYDANQIASRRTPFSIYQGEITAASLANNNCPDSQGNNKILYSAYEGDLMTGALNVALPQGTYTIAVSSNFVGNFGVQIIPTRIVTRSSNTYTQPQRSLPCQASAFTSAALVAPAPITAQYPVHFFDLYAPPTWFNVQAFPSIAFVYAGSVSTSSNVAACPGQLLLNYQNIGCGGNCTTPNPTNGPFIAYTTPSNTYSLLISTLDGSSLSTPPVIPGNPTGPAWGAQVFILAGNNVNPLPPGVTTGTGSTTTGAAGTTTTTGGSATGTTTTGNFSTTTTTSGSSVTSSTSTTSGAVSVSVSAFLVLATFLALLF